MTLDQLKSYHSTKVDSLCPGHPEIENEGIEVSVVAVKTACPPQPYANNDR